MPWATLTLEEFAKELGIDYAETRQKHDLVKKALAIRKKRGITQAQLAKRMKVSQARIAKIESRIGTDKVSFEVIFKMLAALGYVCRVTLSKVDSVKLAA